MKFALKIESFFLQGNKQQVIKMKIKGVIQDLKKEKKIKKMITVKIYLGIFLELLWAVWGQFTFKQFLVPACTSPQGLQASSNAQSMLTTEF